MAITDYNKHQKSIKGLETKIAHLQKIVVYENHVSPLLRGD